MNAHRSLATAYEVVFNEKTGHITISNTDTHWFIPTRDDLTSAGGTWTGSVLNKDDLLDCYDVIGYTNASYTLNGVLQKPRLRRFTPVQIPISMQLVLWKSRAKLRAEGAI